VAQPAGRQRCSGSEAPAATESIAMDLCFMELAMKQEP
jgi:hypothetical protein